MEHLSTAIHSGLWVAAYIRDREIKREKLEKLCRDLLVDELREHEVLNTEQCTELLAKLKQTIRELKGNYEQLDKIDVMNVMRMVPVATKGAVLLSDGVLQVSDKDLLDSITTSTQKAIQEHKDSRGMLNYLKNIATNGYGLAASAILALDLYTTGKLAYATYQEKLQEQADNQAGAEPSMPSRRSGRSLLPDGA